MYSILVSAAVVLKCFINKDDDDDESWNFNFVYIMLM